MDCSNEDGEMWDWQEEDYCLKKNHNVEISQCLWDGISQNEENLSYMFDETTPIKDCGDLGCHVSSSENISKEVQLCRETLSQAKRRRVLQFDTEALIDPHCNEDMSSSFLTSTERENSVQEALSSVSQWVSGFAGDPSASGVLDHSSEEWLSDCFNDAEIHFSHDEIPSGSPDVQIDINEFCSTPPEYEEVIVSQEQPTRTRASIVLKGRRSYMRTPSKLATSVAYPFAFVKPCGVHGDVTLKDINQRIRTPPPSKSKQMKEDSSTSYPTSAFSGKPVVGKTKIRTEGGKGSITIMRTKG